MHAQMMDVAFTRWSDPSVAGYAETRAFPKQPPEPQAARREPATVEIRNASGKMARGIEIELAGFGEADVFRAYYLNRHGTPCVVRTGNSIRVRFESLWRTAAQMLSVTHLAHTHLRSNATRPFVWEFALYGAGGAERFCLETSTRNVTATCRWLVATDTFGSNFAAETHAIPFHEGQTGAGMAPCAGSAE